MTGGALFLAAFLACAVEAVEAATIVLAAGTARGWRSAATGMLAALMTLAVVVAALGPATSRLPLGALRVVVGVLLLLFGLQWLRKAILRAAGHKALHDETRIYAAQLSAAAAAAPSRRTGLVPDWAGFSLAFKGVALEGLEVVFIVISFGAGQHQVGLAALAAGCAVLLIAAAALAVRAPLARVPENTLKFAVGVMLTSFGTFWAAEGAGAHWPGSDAALLVLVPAVALLALGLAVGWPPPAPAAEGAAQPAPATAPPARGAAARRVRAAAAFCYDFVIGDDWIAAADVAAALAATWLLRLAAGAPPWWLLPAAVAVALPASIWRAVRPS